MPNQVNVEQEERIRRVARRLEKAYAELAECDFYSTAKRSPFLRSSNLTNVVSQQGLVVSDEISEEHQQITVFEQALSQRERELYREIWQIKDELEKA